MYKENTYNTMANNALTFSFQEETLIQSPLSDTINMRIAKIGPAIARVYFVDPRTHRELPIPDNFTIYDDSNSAVVPNLYSTDSFALYWGDNYTIEYDQDVILVLVTHRQWNVEFPPERQVISNKPSLSTTFP